MTTPKEGRELSSFLFSTSHRSGHLSDTIAFGNAIRQTPLAPSAAASSYAPIRAHRMSSRLRREASWLRPDGLPPPHKFPQNFPSPCNISHLCVVL